MSKSRVLTAIKPISGLTLKSTTKWTYFPLSEGGVAGTGTGTDAINDSRATTLVDVPMEAAGIANQWTTKDGWWTGNGTDECFIQSWSADAAALDSVFTLGEGAMLIAGQISHSNATEHSILSFGENKDSGVLIYGIRVMAIATTGRISYVLRMNDDTVVNGNAAPGTTSDGGTYNFAVTIDNRVGVKEAIAYDDVAASGVPSSAVTKDTSALGAVGVGNIEANQRLVLGATSSGTDVGTQFFTGSLRRLMVVNYGQSPPASFGPVLTKLFSNGMQPYWGMDE